MLEKEKDVQGVAIYAQFHKPGAMSQIIVTPDGYNESGDLVPGALYRRVVTTYSPKKQWRSSTIRSGEVVNIDFENADHRAWVAEQRLSFAGQLFDSLLSGKWEVHKDPIFLEVSKKDLTDIYAGKTPTKLMYRINQSREALSFETEIPTQD
jgi:hypothetical protein